MRVILIAGPTASGKSSAAIGIAKAVDGVILNADSMQVYRELSILTARPGVEDLAKADHRLYGHIRANTAYDVASWLDDVRREIDELIASNKVPIIVGGTGLYFKALEDGLCSVPPVPSDIREQIRRDLKEKGAPALHADLAALDPAGAEILPPGDGQRIARALEVLKTTGKPLRVFYEEVASRVPIEFERHVIFPERSQLYTRINDRFVHMLDEGALEEVEHLMAMGLDDSLPAMKAIGVKPLGDYLQGKVSLDEATSISQQASRNYAKRQYTWIRNQMSDWVRYSHPQSIIDAYTD